MRVKFLLSLALPVLLTLLLPNIAAADTFDWTYTGLGSDASASGSGVITATPVPNTDYDIVTSFMGSFTDQGPLFDITGLLPPLTGAGGPGTGGNDNLIYPAGDGGPFPGALIDQTGIGFSTDAVRGAQSFMITATFPDCLQCYFIAPGLIKGTFAITPGPPPAATEPGTLSLLLLGLLAFGMFAVPPRFRRT